MTPIEVLQMLKKKIDEAISVNINYVIQREDIKTIDDTLMSERDPFMNRRLFINRVINELGWRNDAPVPNSSFDYTFAHGKGYAMKLKFSSVDADGQPISIRINLVGYKTLFDGKIHSIDDIKSLMQFTGIIPFEAVSCSPSK